VELLVVLLALEADAWEVPPRSTSSASRAAVMHGKQQSKKQAPQ
jgi:hypothetical protein